MNASDIVKAKQSQVLYKAYHRPTVFESTTFSTITPISSFINFVSSGVPLLSTSYASCLTTAYPYVCEPTFVSYESRNQVQSGAYSCAGKVPSRLQWKAIHPTTIYSYSTIYSSLTNPSTIMASTVRVTSTTMLTGTGPIICPLIQFQQGTNFAHTCPTCSNGWGGNGGRACCEQCSA
jgi:hypothetical protein